MRETMMQTPRSLKTEGDKVLQVLEQPMLKTMVRQVDPLQHMELNGGADIQLQPMNDPKLLQVDVPEGDCDPVGSPH